MSTALARARNAIDAMTHGQFVLVGVSGGADSLALAVASSELMRFGKLRAGAIIVDHGLQTDSAAAAEQAAAQCRALGLEPVLIRRVETSDDEASARTARYAAFNSALGETGAESILLAHTLNDQAEQVLLGLLRGSGTRSLAGIPARRGPFLRPLLGLDRAAMEEICTQAGLSWWQDASNTDQRYRRNHIRHRVLPLLQNELGTHLPQALAATASLAAQDAEALEQWAHRAYAELGGADTLHLAELGKLPLAISSRVLRLAARSAGASTPTRERTEALLRLAGLGYAKSKSAGPVQLEGHVAAFRRGPVIVFTRPG